MTVACRHLGLLAVAGRWRDDIQRPRVAFGLNSAWKTGTVELMKPMPTPETIRATIMWAREYAVD